MSEILFIRHAETDMAGTFCGHSDPELNARGWAQVTELVRELHRENLGAVYASDLRRAHATGNAIAEAFHIECHVRLGLREIGFGQWEGLTWKEIEERNKLYASLWSEEYPNLPAPGGEDFSDFEHRVMREVELLTAKAETAARSIAVATHAGVLRTILRAMHGCSEAEAWEQTRSYCSIVRHIGATFSFAHRAEVQS
ncbi:MAG: histidine phosphatase family protein [Edaphobacter sp.]